MQDYPLYRGPGALPLEPTGALPGSEEKIRIMIERASRREQLFHPLDGLPSRGYQAPSMPLVPAWQPPGSSWLPKSFEEADGEETDCENDAFEAVEEEACSLVPG